MMMPEHMLQLIWMRLPAAGMKKKNGKCDFDDQS